MDVLRLIGGNVKARRVERGWTQEQLADQSELDQRYISSLENGRRNPTILKLQQVADALGCSIGHLLRDDQRQ
jgi:transcriptional regulator with XRE-family HTH domain